MTCIIQGLEAWYNQLDPPVLATIVPNASQGLQQAYTDQTIIGWRHLIRGRLERLWKKVIQESTDNRVRNVGTKQNNKRNFFFGNMGEKTYYFNVATKFQDVGNPKYRGTESVYRSWSHPRPRTVDYSGRT